MDINIEDIESPSPSASHVEVVEHKGLGHPDTICDALAERASAALSRHYLERFGVILHHNVDKALLCGGVSRTRFGGGEVLEPMEITLAGRATKSYGGVAIPVEEIIIEDCRRWLRERLHALDHHLHVKLRTVLRPGSSDLVSLFVRQQRTGVWVANDTSCGVGFAPLSETERMVLAIGKRLRLASHEPATAAIGEDVKVMAVRNADRQRFIVACALIDRHVRDVEEYVAVKAQVARLAREATLTVSKAAVEVEVNAGDALPNELYLTVTGTSAESGDDGQVGRGNRVNGLITPQRPMTIEAAAGKNPVSHVGKIYNIAAHEIAEHVVREIAEIAHANCMLVSRIGAPVTEPEVIDVRISTHDGSPPSRFASRIHEIARDYLAAIPALADRIVRGGVTVY
jgi:S-adenosylmethionine synthetase